MKRSRTVYSSLMTSAVVAAVVGVGATGLAVSLGLSARNTQDALNVQVTATRQVELVRRDTTEVALSYAYVSWLGASDDMVAGLKAALAQQGKDMATLRGLKLTKAEAAVVGDYQAKSDAFRDLLADLQNHPMD